MEEMKERRSEIGGKGKQEHRKNVSPRKKKNVGIANKSKDNEGDQQIMRSKENKKKRRECSNKPINQSKHLLRLHSSGFGGLEVPKFAGSDPAEAVGFFRAKKSSVRLPSEGK